VVPSGLCSRPLLISPVVQSSFLFSFMCMTTESVGMNCIPTPLFYFVQGGDRGGAVVFFPVRMVVIAIKGPCFLVTPVCTIPISICMSPILPCFLTLRFFSLTLTIVIAIIPRYLPSFNPLFGDLSAFSSFPALDFHLITKASGHHAQLILRPLVPPFANGFPDLLRWG